MVETNTCLIDILPIHGTYHTFSRLVAWQLDSKSLMGGANSLHKCFIFFSFFISVFISLTGARFVVVAPLRGEKSTARFELSLNEQSRH